MHCIRVELRLADGYYELHPAPEDDGVAELLPPEAEAALEVEQFPSSLLEGKPRLHESPYVLPDLRMPSLTCLCIYV